MRALDNQLAPSMDIPRRLAIAALGGAMLLSMASRASGQDTHASVRSEVNLAFTVGAQIRVRDGESARVVKKAAHSIDVARSVAVGANVPFALVVRVGSLPADVQVSVQNAEGAWVPLTNGAAVAIGAGARGRTVREVVYRLASANPASLERATLSVVLEAHSADASYPALAMTSSVVDTSALGRFAGR